MKAFKISMEAWDAVNNARLTYKKQYEDLCDLIKGDSPNWTHEEIVERLEQQVNALIEKEDPNRVV